MILPKYYLRAIHSINTKLTIMIALKHHHDMVMDESFAISKELSLTFYKSFQLVAVNKGKRIDVVLKSWDMIDSSIVNIREGK